MSLGKRALLTHVAAAIVGMIAGATLAHWTEVQIWHSRALAAYGMAITLNDAGKHDEAGMLLSQAVIANPDNYAPLAMLADIYSHKGNYTLALALYDRALLIASTQNNISGAERDALRKNIEVTQKRIGGKAGPH